MSLAGRARTVLAALRGDDEARYFFAERVARRIHPDAVLSEKDRYWLHDTEFRATYERFQPDNNLRRLDRVWLLRELAGRARRVSGDTAECGVYSGMTSAIICDAIKGTEKRHHVFDSFEGLSQPTAADGTYWRQGDLSCSIDVVRANLARFPFVDYHPGWIPEAFPEVADRTFALVHIDVDLADPTRDAVGFFFPRLEVGGVIVLDDYGFETCPGARREVDAFAAMHELDVIELPTGQGLILRENQ